MKLVAAMVVVMMPSAAYAQDGLIEVARPELSPRTECAADFQSTWEREFRKNLTAYEVFSGLRSDLTKESNELRKQLASAGRLKTVSDWALGVEFVVKKFKIVLDSAVESLNLRVPQRAADALTVATASAEWVGNELKRGRPLRELVSYEAREAFSQHVLTEVAKSKAGWRVEMPLLFAETGRKVFDQESEFQSYRSELRIQLASLDAALEKAEDSMNRAQRRLQEVYDHGFELFCGNNPPIAANDRLTVSAGEELYKVGWTVSGSEVLKNDKDPEKRPLRILPPRSKQGSTKLRDPGTPLDSSDDEIVFVPQRGFTGVARIDYEVADDLGLKSSATIELVIEGDPSGYVTKDEYEGRLEAILARAKGKSQERWTQESFNRYTALERKLNALLNDVRVAAGDAPQRSMWSDALTILKTGLSQKDVRRIDCAESLISGVSSPACAQFTGDLVGDIVDKASQKQRRSSGAGSTERAASGTSGNDVFSAPATQNTAPVQAPVVEQPRATCPPPCVNELGGGPARGTRH